MDLNTLLILVGVNMTMMGHASDQTVNQKSTEVEKLEPKHM